MFWFELNILFSSWLLDYTFLCGFLCRAFVAWELELHLTVQADADRKEKMNEDNLGDTNVKS